MSQQEPLDVPVLLKQFAKKPGCEAYSGDSKKIELLCLYIWMRQFLPAAIAPQFHFESFLELFAPLADFSPENRKHPEDALKYFCPRNKAQAAAAGVEQWSAAEVLDFSCYYVDMLRYCERAGAPVPKTFAEFLGELRDKYKAGAFSQPAAEEPPPPAPVAAPAPPAAAAVPAAPAATPPQEPAPAEAPKKRGRRAAPAAPAQPETSPHTLFVPAVGQRVIYTSPRGRQYLAVVEAVVADADKHYATFLTDIGERFRDVSVLSLQASTEPLPLPPLGPDNKTPLPRQDFTYRVPAGVYEQFRKALALCASGQPMGNVAIGEVICSCDFSPPELAGATAVFDVVNSSEGPYLDSYLLPPGAAPGPDTKALAENKPRDSGCLDGVYSFIIPGDRVIVIDVKPYRE